MVNHGGNKAKRFTFMQFISLVIVQTCNGLIKRFFLFTKRKIYGTALADLAET